MNDDIDLSKYTPVDPERQPAAPLKLSKTLSILMAVGFAALIILAILHAAFKVNVPSLIFPLLLLVTMGAGILGAVSKKWMINHAPVCSDCQRTMTRHEVPADPDDIPFYVGATKIVRGKYGHCFILCDEHSRSGGSMRTSDDTPYELRKLFFACKNCGRYLMVEPYHKVPLTGYGRGENAIEERERKIEQIRSTMRNLEGKRIVVKHGS